MERAVEVLIGEVDCVVDINISRARRCSGSNAFACRKGRECDQTTNQEFLLLHLHLSRRIRLLLLTTGRRPQQTFLNYEKIEPIRIEEFFTIPILSTNCHSFSFIFFFPSECSRF